MQHIQFPFGKEQENRENEKGEQQEEVKKQNESTK